MNHGLLAVDQNNNFVSDDEDDFGFIPQFDENNNIIEENHFEINPVPDALDVHETDDSNSVTVDTPLNVSVNDSVVIPVPSAAASHLEASISTDIESSKPVIVEEAFIIPSPQPVSNDSQPVATICDARSECAGPSGLASLEATRELNTADESNSNSNSNTGLHPQASKRDEYRTLAELVREFHQQTPIRFRSTRKSERPQRASPFESHVTVPHLPNFASARLLQSRRSTGISSAKKPCLSNATNTHVIATDTRNATRRASGGGGCVRTQQRNSSRYAPYPVVARRVSLFSDQAMKLVEQAIDVGDVSEDIQKPHLGAILEKDLPDLIGTLQVTGEPDSTKLKAECMQSDITTGVGTFLATGATTRLSGGLNGSAKQIGKSNDNIHGIAIPTLPSCSGSSDDGHKVNIPCARNLPFTFRAQEAKVLRVAPFRPTPSTRPLTVAEEFNFALPKRFEQRRQFEAKVGLHHSVVQRAHVERDRLMREVEAQERRQRRSATTFRAQPVPRSIRARVTSSTSGSTGSKREAGSVANNKENESRR